MCDTSHAVLPNIHLYPTFDEIEYGLCPTVADLDKFEKLGMGYEQMFTDYFTPVNKHGYENYPTEIENLDEACSALSLSDYLIQADNSNNMECSKLQFEQEIENYFGTNHDSESTDDSENIVQRENLNLDNKMESQILSVSKITNPPPGFKSNTISPEEQKINIEKISGLANTLNCLHFYVINKGSSYQKDIIQLIFSQIESCSNILKLMGISIDRTEHSVLKKNYVDTIQIIQELIESQKKLEDNLQKNLEGGVTSNSATESNFFFEESKYYI